MSKDDPKRKPGPNEERLKLDGDWEDAMKQAMEKPRPEGGWPDQGDQEDDEETPSE
ncbi:MAG: hypothetical protein AAGB26_13940 [Planctomycetota bacterium]